MANLIAVVAPSGFGKSTSLFPNADIGIKGLDPKQTILINISAKPLPVRGASKMYDPSKSIKEGGNYVETDNPTIINDIIKYVSENRNEVTSVVIDDFGYVMAFDVMRRVGDKGYEKWTELAASMFKVLHNARTYRRDLNIVCTFHQEKGEDGTLKIKTAGKLLDNAVFLDGLFTFIFYGVIQKDFKANSVNYKFQTQSTGDSTCKSPVGCFDEQFIPNDMGYVLDKINEYYN